MQHRSPFLDIYGSPLPVENNNSEMYYLHEIEVNSTGSPNRYGREDTYSPSVIDSIFRDSLPITYSPVKQDIETFLMKTVHLRLT